VCEWWRGGIGWPLPKPESIGPGRRPRSVDVGGGNKGSGAIFNQQRGGNAAGRGEARRGAGRGTAVQEWGHSERARAWQSRSPGVFGLRLDR